MQACVLKVPVWSLLDQKSADSTISHFSPLILSSSRLLDRTVTVNKKWAQFMNIMNNFLCGTFVRN